MKRVPLVNSDLFALVDDEDFELVSSINWYLADNPGRSHPLRYAFSPVAGGFMHRILLNPADGMVTDHIDHDGLNNQRSNLRALTPQENSVHRRMNSNNKSGFRGVSLDEDGKWVACITHKQKYQYLGRFTSAEDAALAFDREAYRLRGDLAKLNFPYLVGEEIA